MLTVLVSAALAAVTAMAADPPGGMNMPGMQMSGSASTQKEKVGHTTGKVVQINAAGSRITIAHHPVAALGWPAMTMTFEVSSRQLKGIKPGDQVDFEFHMRGSAAVIERIHKIG
jgi:Cu(I)/Ag(I) efflux system protein CusF